jgi:hypothetical protein
MFLICLRLLSCDYLGFAGDCGMFLDWNFKILWLFMSISWGCLNTAVSLMKILTVIQWSKLYIVTLR